MQDIISFTVAMFGMSCFLAENKNKTFSHQLVIESFCLLINAPKSFDLNFRHLQGALNFQRVQSKLQHIQ
jgi:hypothetical protein